MKQLNYISAKSDTDEDSKLYLTKSEILESLKKIFRKHIGSKNPITKSKLYTKIFGDPSIYEPYELWYNWTKIRQTMNFMRKSTKFFIVCKQNEKYSSIWEYYVVVDMADADTYKSILKGTKRKIDFMLKRCDEAINKRFWKDVRDGKD
jgi:hypothetical protein